ncbi:MAG: HNH endonuclease, partial [Pseudomonadota bacterium]|nr:HNH endonuclease [Pseudomonadota bacterium]
VIQSTGRGQRQVQKSDKYGFPRNRAGRVKQVHGFRTGDLAMLSMSKGKYAGEHIGRVTGVRADGRFDLNRITSTWRNFQLLQRADGYAYS